MTAEAMIFCTVRPVVTLRLLREALGQLSLPGPTPALRGSLDWIRDGRPPDLDEELDGNCSRLEFTGGFRFWLSADTISPDIDRMVQVLSDPESSSVTFEQSDAILWASKIASVRWTISVEEDAEYDSSIGRRVFLAMVDRLLSLGEGLVYIGDANTCASVGNFDRPGFEARFLNDTHYPIAE